jgi:hypothetical protein
MKRIHHRLLLDPQQLAIGHGSRGSHAERLPGQRAFAKKIPLIQYSDGGFLANLGYDSKFHLAFLNVENCVGHISLGEDDLLFRNGEALPALAHGGDEGVGVELAANLESSIWTRGISRSLGCLRRCLAGDFR